MPSQPSQISKMEPFAKIIIFTNSSILGAADIEIFSPAYDPERVIFKIFMKASVYQDYLPSFFPFEIVCTFDSEAATRDVHSKKISKILQILQEKCYAEVSF